MCYLGENQLEFFGDFLAIYIEETFQEGLFFIISYISTGL